MDSKPVHSLVLDTGAIIRNEPSVSTLLAQSENLVTVPAILSEIKDAGTRSRVETTLRPFLTIKSPNPTSIKFVTDFARRTGDLIVLSKPDIQIIALTYQIECERNGGDWRLRKVPGQKSVNGKPPARMATVDDATASQLTDAVLSTAASLAPEKPAEEPSANSIYLENTSDPAHASPDEASGVDPGHSAEALAPQADTPVNAQRISNTEDVSEQLTQTNIIEAPAGTSVEISPKIDSAQNSGSSDEESSSDSGGWITPSNLRKKQAEDAGASTTEAKEQTRMQVAVLTTDFAMQNVILQMNLNLLSPSLHRMKHLKTFALRCHGCFQICKEMTKQFCPRCGNPTLTRVACSTNGNGEFKLHLKKNMQWNHRGNRYSIPKAVHGSAHGRVKGGGKDGWGNGLILAEDQKEFQRAAVQEKRNRERNLMDEDYLPGILTGDRRKSGGRVKVGAGRNINAKTR